MTKQQILWLVFVGVFVAPLVVYFFGSLYLWIFAGVALDEDKMVAAFITSLLATLSALLWDRVGEVWE